MFEDYTRNQLDRIFRRMVRYLAKADGYQPFGHDRHTLRITHPQIASALQDLYIELHHRTHAS